MKIEKVNDHQIRCTLTKADLADRELKISELAYGTEKAKNLFRDMMQQASFEFGFEADDIPLMIEAIPLNSDCIVLIITKVEDPEELDTRFSKFAPSVHDSDSDSEDDESVDEFLNHFSGSGADDVLDLFKRIHDNKSTSGDTSSDKPQEKQKNDLPSLPPRKLRSRQSLPFATTSEVTRIYHFKTLSLLTQAADVLSDSYTGTNSLFKNTKKGIYSLVLSKGHQSPEEFNKICNILSEYGISDKVSSANEYYLEEHGRSILRDNALQTLMKI